MKKQFLFSVPGEIRTPDRRLRRPLLYPAELLGHSIKIIFDFADTFSVSTATPLSVSPFKKRLEWCADVTSMMQIRSCSIQLSYWDIVSKVTFRFTILYLVFSAVPHSVCLLKTPLVRYADAFSRKLIRTCSILSLPLPAYSRMTDASGQLAAHSLMRCS